MSVQLNTSQTVSVHTPLGTLDPFCSDVLREILKYLPANAALILATRVSKAISGPRLYGLMNLKMIAGQEQQLLLFPEKMKLTTAADISQVCFPMDRDSLSKHFFRLPPDMCRKIRTNIEARGGLWFYEHLTPTLVLLRDNVVMAKGNETALMNLAFREEEKKGGFKASLEIIAILPDKHAAHMCKSFIEVKHEHPDDYRTRPPYLRWPY